LKDLSISDWQEVDDLLWDEPEPTAIMSIKEIDYYVARIGRNQQRIEEIERRGNDLINRMRERIAEATKAYRNDVDYCTAMIKEPTEIEIMKGKAKSLKLPCGTVGVRIGRESVVIDDEDAAIEWAETFKPEAVKVEKHILKSEINGTACPGYHVERGANSFYCKPDSDLFRLEEK